MHIPLKVTTDYTLLKSLIKMPDLISFLCDNKINACGICDENLYGVLDFYFSCKKNNIKPIIGLSIKLNNLEVCLYAINYEGYKNLLKIHTLKEKNELNVLNIKEFCKNILVILPYESKELYNEFSCFDVIFIGYKTQYEKINALAITKNIVFFKDLRVLKKEEVSYLKYLDILRKDNIEVNSDCCYCDDVNDENIEKIVKLINIEIPLDKRYIPKYSDNSYELLRNLCVKGLNKRLNGKVSKEYVDRLKYELDVINKMGFVDYFLIVYDYVLYAKKNNILVGPGRGSAAGSLVSYSIGITEIDPISFGLMFERFLNPERITMPDIDIDFDAYKREQVIDYVRSKYGMSNVALGLTFTTFKSKLVLREVGKILNISNNLLDSFIKCINGSLSLKDNLKNEIVKKYINNYKEIKNLYVILTANNVSDIPKPILDRVELIELHSYTVFEKKDIAKNYMLPNILLDNMVYDNKIKFSDELLYFLINNYTDEAGVRDLERILSSLARKITINNVKILNEERVVKLLGNPKYTSNLVMEEENGVVNTLAVSNSGGTLSKVEVVTCKGNDKLTITGNAGNILKESISVVLTMLKLKYKYSFHNEDIHVHFLDASSKKDGPSAGIALSVALCSLKENKKVPSDVAFTGEVSLNGSILKIGGLKEKLIAAYNKNIKVVYMPKSNSEDLENVPKLILDNMEVIPVSNFNEVYTKLFK